MSSLTLDHLTLDDVTSARSTTFLHDLGASSAPSVGSYVDADGNRRPAHLVGKYVTRRSTGVRAIGSYTDVDGGRSTARLGSYVRSER